MAESAVKEELKCSICLDNFKNPKDVAMLSQLLSPLSGGSSCLEGAHERTKDKKSLTCTQCKAQHQVCYVYNTCLIKL